MTEAEGEQGVLLSGDSATANVSLNIGHVTSVTKEGNV
jgi:hypothetical protein